MLIETVMYETAYTLLVLFNSLSNNAKRSYNLIYFIEAYYTFNLFKDYNTFYIH